MSRRIAPRRIRRLKGRLLVARHRSLFRGMGVEDTFQRVYEEGWWGSGLDFDSGEGSTEAHLTDPYVEVVRRLINERGICSVADLGCGDFRVGRRLLSPSLQYVGVDVVKDLVDRNNRCFGDQNVTFRHANLIEDELPSAGLGLLRQVLQHLSNAEATAVLDSCGRYQQLLVTEHVCTGVGVRPNVDKPHGPDTRITENSGLFFDEPPFSMRTQVLLEVSCAEDEVLRTVLIENQRA